MEQRPRMPPPIPGMETLRRVDAAGNIFGEWSTANKEQSPRDELHVQSRGVRFDLRTDAGGPESKYGERNEDVFFVIAEEDEFFAGVVDGSGGSDDGRKAARFGARALARTYRAGERDHQNLVEQADDYIIEHLHGSYATGVLIQGKRLAKGHWQLELANYGDCKVLGLRNGKKRPEATSFPQNTAGYLCNGTKRWDEYYNHQGTGMLLAGFGVRATSDRREPPQYFSCEGKVDDQFIVGSDGFWDLVSEYEVIELSKRYRGRELQEKLYELAHQRNNEKIECLIYFDAHTTIRKNMAKVDQQGRPKKAGDNITIGVIELNEIPT